jgi:hypothetical protein
MQKYLFLIYIIVLNTSCSNSKNEEKAFLEILGKIHECEAYQEIKLENKDSIFLSSCIESIFAENKQYDKNEFMKSLKKYQQNGKEYEIIYDSLINKLSIKENL